MDGTLRILLVIVATSVPAALIHEFGRAAAALALTKGRVCVLLGSGRPLFSVRIGRLLIGPTRTWLWGGECLHAPTVSRRRQTAILLTGPLAGDLCFAVACAVAITWRGGPNEHATLQLALFVFALVALARASADLVRAHGHRPATTPNTGPRAGLSRSVAYGRRWPPNRRPSSASTRPARAPTRAGWMS